MPDKPEWWELDGFLSHMAFVHRKMPDHNFAWVLGAGASKQSGIPTGGELVGEWLNELCEQQAPRGTLVKDWATADNLGIDKFEYKEAAAFYPQVYEKRFRDHPEEGYAYLQDLMSGEIYPGPGYAVLSRVLESTRHRAVITTNFDNLVADALSAYSEAFPLVCGHESLADFVHTTLKRPLICKIHRDILLAPRNDPHGVKRLKGAWSRVLESLLDRYTPVFIGYGGNDESLMGLLDSLEPDQIHGRLIWCHYDPDPDPKNQNDPSQAIQDLVAYHRGVLVRVPDFDQLMILLGQKLGATLPDVTKAEEKKRAKREAAFRKGIEHLDVTSHPGILSAMTSVLGGWGCARAALAETNKDKQEAIYREGIAQFPKHLVLHGNFAIFMWEVRENYDAAEELFRKALELDPKHASNTANFGSFLLTMGPTEEAAPMLKRADELNAGEVNGLAADIALNRGVLALVTGGDDTAGLKRLKTLLDQGFERGSASFDSLLAFAKTKLSKDDYALYAALAEATLDADKLPEADRLLQKRLERPSPPPRPSAKKKAAKRKATRKPAKKKKKK